MRVVAFSLVFAPAVLAQAPDNSLWATNFLGTTKSISKIDPRGSILTTVVPGTLTPFGLAVDSAGNIWNGSNGNQVAKTDQNGVSTTTFPVGSFPQSVAIDMLGNVWVANRSSNTVMKLDSAGTQLVTVPLPSGTAPIGVVVDALNQVWVSGFHSSTSTTHTMTVLDNAGTVLNTFSYASPVAAFGFSFPAAAPNGNIWVANQAQGALLQIDQAGSVVSTTPVGTGLPRGCAVDGLGYAWVANQGTGGSCMKIDASGVVQATFLQAGTGTTFTTVSIDGNGDPWLFGTSAGKAFKLWQVDATPLCEVALPAGGSAWGGDSSGFHLAQTLLPTSDFDGDAVPNGIEIQAGTNPFDIASNPGAPLPIQSGVPIAGSPVNFTFRLRADANLLYASLISLGNGPTPLPDSRLVPMSLPVFILSAGLMDANGDARTSMVMPSGPGVVGQTFYMSYITFDGAASLGIRTIGNALPITLQ
jgi:streptogramin lyase